MDAENARPVPSLTDEDCARFASIVGEKYALRDPDDISGYLVEPRQKYQGQTPLVLRPGTTHEVSEILKLASALRLPIITQGGNTGLVGGQIPFDEGREIVLSVSRLNRIRNVDPAGGTMTVEAGVTLQRAQQEAEGHDRLFPLSLASEGTCQIGGNLATNAGGMQVLAYGNARNLCLGLEVVLADGRIWNGLRTLRKDNTGYDLRDLFIGSEGTLGVITAAVLKLSPQPVEQASAFVGLSDLDAVAAFFDGALAALGPSLTRFELMPRIGMELVLKHTDGTRDPLEEAHPWYVLMEVSTNRSGGEAMRAITDMLETAFEQDLVADATIATSKAQANDFWMLREMLSEVQGREGGSIKNDVAVPVAAIPEFIRTAGARVETVVPGARPVPFGHYGDGNIHYNISQPIGMDRKAYLARWDEVCNAVNAVVLKLGGSISAEHGIGRMKRHLMEEIKSPVELDLMRSLKQTFDPLNILNPGKVV